MMDDGIHELLFISTLENLKQLFLASVSLKLFTNIQRIKNKSSRHKDRGLIAINIDLQIDFNSIPYNDKKHLYMNNTF